KKSMKWLKKSEENSSYCTLNKKQEKPLRSVLLCISVLTFVQKTTEFWRKVKSKEAPQIKGLPPSPPESPTSPLFSSSGHLILSASFSPKNKSPNGVLYSVPSMEERLQEKREEN